MTILNKTNVCYYATGKRKTAISKIWLYLNGSGLILVNGKSIKNYFLNIFYINLINKPISLFNISSSINLECYVYGGGLSGQAGAISYGISNVFNKLDYSFHKKLRSNMLLTRDSRIVERKKYGLAKSRKRFQFSKR